MMKIVVAIGGNMISDASKKGERFSEQQERIHKTAQLLVELIKKDNDLVITHGNGPQVGSLLLQQNQEIDGVTSLPLKILGALTQGQIGVMMQHALLNELKTKGIEKDVIVVPTTVLVNQDDPGFKNPSKPIGPFYNEEQFKKLDKDEDHVFIKLDKGRRRVVPSPYPVRILESKYINELSKNAIVISVGGGGSPAIEEDGKLKLVDAVIDKDLASSRLALNIDADMLLILTNIEGVYRNFGTENQKLLSKITVQEAKELLENNELGSGSMAPKVQAGIEFASLGDTIITSPENVIESINGGSGTRILSE